MIIERGRQQKSWDLKSSGCSGCSARPSDEASCRRFDRSSMHCSHLGTGCIQIASSARSLKQWTKHHRTQRAINRKTGLRKPVLPSFWTVAGATCPATTKWYELHATVLLEVWAHAQAPASPHVWTSDSPHAAGVSP